MYELLNDPKYFLIALAIVCATALGLYAVGVFGHAGGSVYIGPAQVDGGGGR